ncbi:DUF2637 domain-containing protein [Kitasatospora purpeofusca]|uniref:DUF2637 domain-containing protein n=1 Tax=Kitasatospora purpeofusca TaxID=67352 RepID=UPI0035E2F78E
MTRPTINRGHKALITVVIIGVTVIAAIGFAGSYKAVWALAEREGFGWFSGWLPIGVDAGIVVLYAFDLLLTWLRMPFPLLRQTALVLTIATIVMNSASAWGNPLAMGMHAVVPVLFIIVVEGGRHLVARWASLEAGRPQNEGFTFGRWVNEPFGTLAMWRRKHIWGITSNEDLIQLEKRRRILRRMLKKKYGRRWRSQSSELAQVLFSMAEFGEGDPRLYDDALAELGVSLRPRDAVASVHPPAATNSQQLGTTQPSAIPSSRPAEVAVAVPAGSVTSLEAPIFSTGPGGAAQESVNSGALAHSLEKLGNAVGPVPTGTVSEPASAAVPLPAQPEPARAEPLGVPTGFAADETVLQEVGPEPEYSEDSAGPDATPDPRLDASEATLTARERVLYRYYVAYVHEKGQHPDKEGFVQWAYDEHGETGQDGGPLSPESVKRYWSKLTNLYRQQYETPQSDLLQMAGSSS